METIDCDVLVVGGGPAGCSAARAASLSGKDVLLIDKKDNFKGIACAEGFGSYLLPLLPFKIPPKLFKKKTSGMRFMSGDVEVIKKGGFYKGWTLEREEFDEWLMKKAKKSGSAVRRKCELMEIKYSGDYNVEECKIDHDGKEILVRPSKVVASDGVNSDVAKSLEVLKENEVGHVYSWELDNLDIKYPNLEQLFFGDFAPRAYAYIFPKSNSRANVGVASTLSSEGLEEKFDYFLDNVVSDQMGNFTKKVERSGKAPTKNQISRWRYGDIVFTGDAANQNFKPYVEGILPGIICGHIAGEFASGSSSREYRAQVMKKLGNSFQESDLIFDKMYEIYDKFDGEKRDLLVMYLFTRNSVEAVERVEDMPVGELKKTISKEGGGIDRLVSMLWYISWYSKVLTTGSD